MKKKALFLDRDGVINLDEGYTSEWSPKIIIENVIDVVKKFREHGYLIFVVTNQSGIGRGYYSDDDFKIFMKHLFTFFHKKNANFDAYYYCSCDPTKNFCINRKPNPGMFFSAASDYSIDLTKSVMIGDNISDMIAADTASIQNKFLYVPFNKKHKISNDEVEYQLVHSLLEINVPKI